MLLLAQLRNSESRAHSQIYTEQVRLLYRNAPLGLIATLINSAVLVYILRNVVPHRVLIAWFACILLVSTLRLVQLSRFRRIPAGSPDVGRWGTWFIIGLGLSGIIWGSAGILLYPARSIIHQEFLAFVLGGMAVGAAEAFSVVISAFLAYMLPSLAPLIVRFLVAGDEIHLAMGGMSLLFVVLITGIAFRIRSSTVASLLLRFENNNLIISLSSAKNDLENLNRELSSEIEERRKAEEELMTHREHLEDLVEERTSELEAFIYSVSHDLKGPLRAISGFGNILMEDQAGRLDEKSRDYLKRVNLNAVRMGQLIDDLLALSRVSRQEIERTKLDLSKIASRIVDDLRASDPSRSVDVRMAEGLVAYGDENLITIVLTNLFDNAWKFTAKTVNPRIEFGTHMKDGKSIYYVRDNGVGFDVKQGGKMFLPFHRLHSEKEFEATGIGLAIVNRIIHRHGGNVWAEGAIGIGTTLYFTI